MSFLSLTDDEVALLRFTCDLFFVEESPLLYLENERREPTDYEATYHALIGRRILSPTDFRVTDDALNRIAPITECDARVVYIGAHVEREVEEADFYLLDEIAVQYVRGTAGHAFGPDLDAGELVDFIARRMIPRRAGGDRIDLTLTSTEFLAFSLLLQSPHAHRGIARRELRALLGRSPSASMLSGTAAMLQVLTPRRTDPTMRRSGGDTLSGDLTWDDALHGLIEKGALSIDGEQVLIRPRLLELMSQSAQVDRHTIVRYDFGDDEWFMREATFLSLDGVLLWLATRPDGRVDVRELDGDGLRVALTDAVGPLPRANEAVRATPSRRGVAEGDEEDDATEVAMKREPTETQVDPLPRSR
jgi:hypothetical protein